MSCDRFDECVKFHLRITLHIECKAKTSWLFVCHQKTELTKIASVIHQSTSIIDFDLFIHFFFVSFSNKNRFNHRKSSKCWFIVHLYYLLGNIAFNLYVVSMWISVLNGLNGADSVLICLCIFPRITYFLPVWIVQMRFWLKLSRKADRKRTVQTGKNARFIS